MLKKNTFFILFIFIVSYIFIYINFYLLKNIFIKKKKPSFLEEEKQTSSTIKIPVKKKDLFSKYYKTSYLDHYGKVQYAFKIIGSDLSSYTSYIKVYYKKEKENFLIPILEEEYQEGKIIRYSKFSYNDILKKIKNIPSKINLDKENLILEEVFDENYTLVSIRLFNKYKKLIFEWVYNLQKVIKYIHVFYDPTTQKKYKENHYNSKKNLEYYVIFKYKENSIEKFMYTLNGDLISKY